MTTDFGLGAVGYLLGLALVVALIVVVVDKVHAWDVKSATGGK